MTPKGPELQGRTGRPAPSSVSLDEVLADASFPQDPYPVYARLREEAPIHWCEPWGQWVVTRYQDVQRVLRDPSGFSSSGWEADFIGRLPDGAGRLEALRRHYATAVLSNTDPPAHTRLRRLVVKSFTPRVLASIRPEIETLVETLLDDLDGAARVDVLARFAYPLPAIVIARLLGAPFEERERFERWSSDIVAFVGSGSPLADRAERADRSIAEFRQCLVPLIDERRGEPRDDLLSQLISSDEGEVLTEDELVATCITLLFAGHETTANLIANGLLALLRHPEELARLSADPACAATAVEELLRYDSPVQRIRRVAVADVEVGGRLVRGGDRVMAFTGSANRDPDRFPEPDRLDLTRGDIGHLAFGYGIHFCVGAALSRIEAPIALNALLRRFPRLRLSDVPVRWKPNITFRGLESLELELG